MSAAEAYNLIDCPDAALDSLLDAASALRDQFKGRNITYSRKIFHPSRTCAATVVATARSARSTDPDAWTITVEIDDVLIRGVKGLYGSIDVWATSPKQPSHRETLAEYGHRTLQSTSLGPVVAIGHGFRPTNARAFTR
jgi:hypothetical protein